MSEGEGLPLQLTTITVAVPTPLSPNSAAVLSVPGMGIGGQQGTALSPSMVNQQQDYGAFKWKYEQTRTDKLNSTLVLFNIRLSLFAVYFHIFILNHNISKPPIQDPFLIMPFFRNVCVMGIVYIGK